MNEVRLNNLFDLEPFDAELRNWLRPWRSGGNERTPQIRIDVNETDAAYLVKADIPGVRKEDIDVRIDGRQLTISAEVKQEKDEKKDGRVLRSERQYGYASRSFALASEVDEGRSEARYADGVLELKLPKKAAGASKRLSIS